MRTAIVMVAAAVAGAVICLAVAFATTPNPVACALAVSRGYHGEPFPCPQPSRDWGLAIEAGLVVAVTGGGAALMTRRRRALPD